MICKQQHAVQVEGKVETAVKAKQRLQAEVEAAQFRDIGNAIAALQNSSNAVRRVQQQSLDALSRLALSQHAGTDIFVSAFVHTAKAQSTAATDGNASMQQQVQQAVRETADAALSATSQAVDKLTSSSPLAQAVNYLVKVFKLGQLAFMQGLQSWQRFCSFVASPPYRQRIVGAMPSLQEMQAEFLKAATAMLSAALNGADSVTTLAAINSLAQFRLKLAAKLAELGRLRAVQSEFNMVDKFVVELSAVSGHFVSKQQHVGRDLREKLSQVYLVRKSLQPASYPAPWCLCIHHVTSVIMT